MEPNQAYSQKAFDVVQAIFRPRDLQELLIASELNKEAIKVKGSLEKSIRQNFEIIKEDHETHDKVFSHLGDVSSFVLPIRYKVDLGELKESMVDKRLTLKLGLEKIAGKQPRCPKLMLYVNRNRYNAIFFGVPHTVKGKTKFSVGYDRGDAKRWDLQVPKIDGEEDTKESYFLKATEYMENIVAKTLAERGSVVYRDSENGDKRIAKLNGNHILLAYEASIKPAVTSSAGVITDITTFDLS